MKVQVTQANLARALNTVARVASVRGTLPILANVLLKTESGRLNIMATNLDVAISHFVGTKVEKEGAITVPARLMQDFVTNLPEDVINLEVEDKKLSVKTDRYNSVINGIEADDFPLMPAISSAASWKVPTADFKSALSKVVFAASADDARPVLTGVYFKSAGGEVNVAATDSYRLAEAKVGKSASDVEFLVPGGAINDLLRIISDNEKEVVVKHDDQQVQFSSGDVTLVARLIEGTYPDYKKLIPTKFATTARLSRDDFLGVTKVSALFARESAGSVTVSVSKASGQLSINAVAAQLGENTAKADAKVSGDGEVTLNSRYLAEALGAFSADEVEFCFNGKLEPCVLRSLKEADYLHLIMPLRS